MEVSGNGRARRVAAARGSGAEHLGECSYLSAFAVDVTGAAALSAEQWAQNILERPPRFLRWFVAFGWRFVLGLRLASDGVHGTVAGWTQIADSSTPTSITLEATSTLLTARKVLEVDAHRVTLATYVWFLNRRGRLVWTAAAPLHHRLEPLLITQAASRYRAETTDGGG